MTVSVGDRERPKDLPAAIFVVLAAALFNGDGVPVPFGLADKRNTQDDPLDQYITQILNDELPDQLFVIPSAKKLVSPDIVVARPEEYQLLRAGGTDLDQRAIVGVEVKKLERDARGNAARASGLDYNSTPPSESIKVIAEDRSSELWIPAQYLFIVLDAVGHPGTYQVSTLALVTGAALNRDISLYERAVGIRRKSIGLGTYGDGADRQRPMFVFGNPLGWPWLAGAPTLIHDRDDLAAEQQITRVGSMVRSVQGSSSDERFYCYRPSELAGREIDEVRDPFPSPTKRKVETSPRGRFVISFDRVPR